MNQKEGKMAYKDICYANIRMRVSFANTNIHRMVVEKNTYIEKEYENYIRINSRDGKRNRLLEWFFLLRLHIAYFVLNRRSNIKQTIDDLDYTIPESEMFNMIAPQHFMKQLLNYDVISIDVFDTLIFRPFSSPSTLFGFMEEKVGVTHFAGLRQEVERALREQKEEKEGTREITLDEIDELLSRYTGIEKQFLSDLEIGLEKEFCYANPYMLAVFSMLISYGKKVIITTDMYLPKSVIEEILSTNGYRGYSDVFVSCECLKSKANGELYEYIKQKYGTNLTYIHVGDNIASDIDMAKEHGWDAKLYQNVHSVRAPLRATGISEVIRSAYQGIIDNHLHNGLDKYNVSYEFGFRNGGLYCLGFVNWIHKYSLEKDIEKIIFLARDGDIYKKIYDELFNDIPSEYMYWSRIATIKTNIEKNQYDFIRRVSLYPVINKADISIKDSLESVGLGSLEEEIPRSGLKIDEILTDDNQKEYEHFLINHMNSIRSIYDSSLWCEKEYISAIIGDAKKVAIIDVGWNGTGPLGLKELIEKKWKMDCEVKCLLAACSNSGNYRLLNEDVEAYLFSVMHNRIHYDNHYSLRNRKYSNDIFELLTQASYPSFCGFSESGEMKFSLPCVEAYKTINDIHQGIMDFVHLYYKSYHRHGYMFNISGYDAYCSFRDVLKYKKYMSDNFGEFPIETDTGKAKKVTGLNEYLKKKDSI